MAKAQPAPMAEALKSSSMSKPVFTTKNKRT